MSDNNAYAFRPVAEAVLSAAAHVRVRDFQADDLAALEAVFLSSVRGPAARYYDAAQIAAWIGDAADAAARAWRIAHDLPWVAELDGRAIGFADLQPDGLIDMFFVAAGHTGHGAGRMLMAHIEAAARCRGLAHLHADVSRAAEGFFVRAGFSVERRQTAVRHGVALDNARMVKALKHGPG